jgi:hypothetical protein
MKNYGYTRRDDILRLIHKGYSISEIHQKTGTSHRIISEHLLYYKGLKDSPLGHKNEPYYKTEAEMLEKPQYDYKSLSESEKAIFHAL